MIGVTLTELMDRLTSRLSEGDTEFFTDANKIAWLNEAQDVICEKVPFTVETTWLTSTIPNVGMYLLDDECLHPTGATIRLSGGQLVRLNYTEPDIMDRMKSWAGGANVPTQYLDLVVTGHKRPRPLTDSSDRTEIPKYVATPIVDYALAKAKQKDEEMGQHDRGMAEFTTHLEHLQAARMIEQADQNNRGRVYRGITNLGRGMFFRTYSCTYRKTLDGQAIELYGLVGG